MDPLFSCMPSRSQLPCNALACAAPILQQHRLRHLLHSLPVQWIYAIFWSISSLDRLRPENASADGPHPVLSWADGVLRTGEIHRPDITTVIGITDLELFYLASQERFYSIDLDCAPVLARAWVSGLPVWLSGEIQLQMSGCDRCREALLHGVATLVSIPTDHGVLELGSSQACYEDWCLVQHAKAALHPAAVSVQTEAGTELVAASLRESNDKERRRRKGRRDNQQVSGSHVDAERHRREKLRHRLYDLRSVVPIVTKMDTLSVLEDAVVYIKELRDHVRELEARAETNRRDHPSKLAPEAITAAAADTMGLLSVHGRGEEVEVDVKVVEGEAMIVVASRDEDHPVARVMDVLKELGVQVYHGSVAVVGERLLQKVAARAPVGLQTEQVLKAALLRTLEDK